MGTLLPLFLVLRLRVAYPRLGSGYRPTPESRP